MPIVVVKGTVTGAARQLPATSVTSVPIVS